MTNKIEEARQKFMRGEMSAQDYWNVRVAELNKYRIEKEDEEQPDLLYFNPQK